MNLLSKTDDFIKMINLLSKTDVFLKNNLVIKNGKVQFLKIKSISAGLQ